MSKIIITGGAGFIGRSLIERCLESKDEVMVIDNFSFGKYEHVRDFKDKIICKELDILDQKRLKHSIGEFQPDIVFHMAALHFIPYCNQNPCETLRINVEGTAAVIESCLSLPKVKILLASTGAIYRSTPDPLNEDFEESLPTDIYGESKYLMEELLNFYSSFSNTSFIIARLFNNYGPYETNPHLIPHIIESLHKNRHEVVLGNIESKRDYIYVKDCAAALYHLCQLSSITSGEVFNLGTGVQYSAKEIIEMISTLLASPIKIKQDPSRLRPVDKMFQIADITKISRTGWQPSYTLEKGLGHLLQFEGLLK